MRDNAQRGNNMNNKSFGSPAETGRASQRGWLPYSLPHFCYLPFSSAYYVFPFHFVFVLFYLLSLIQLQLEGWIKNSRTAFARCGEEVRPRQLEGVNLYPQWRQEREDASFVASTRVHRGSIVTDTCSNTHTHSTMPVTSLFEQFGGLLGNAPGKSSQAERETHVEKPREWPPPSLSVLLLPFSISTRCHTLFFARCSILGRERYSSAGRIENRWLDSLPLFLPTNWSVRDERDPRSFYKVHPGNGYITP